MTNRAVGHIGYIVACIAVGTATQDLHPQKWFLAFLAVVVAYLAGCLADRE